MIHYLLFINTFENYNFLLLRLMVLWPRLTTSVSRVRNEFNFYINHVYVLWPIVGSSMVLRKDQYEASFIGDLEYYF